MKTRSAELPATPSENLISSSHRVAAHPRHLVCFINFHVLYACASARFCSLSFLRISSSARANSGRGSGVYSCGLISAHFRILISLFLPYAASHPSRPPSPLLFRVFALSLSPRTASQPPPPPPPLRFVRNCLAPCPSLSLSLLLPPSLSLSLALFPIRLSHSRIA